MSQVVAILGWVFFLGVLFAVIYGPWNTEGRYVPQAEAASYWTFFRFAWGAGVAWIIFATLQGYGGKNKKAVFSNQTLTSNLTRRQFYCDH